MMDARRAMTKGVWCPIPWTGVMFNHDGRVKNCIRSAGAIGDLCEDDIQDILLGPTNLENQQRMLDDLPARDCHTCYDLEGGKRRLDIISDRIFYMRELKREPFDLYQLGQHELRVVDLRWSNLCNFACVYCGPEFSSRWASELSVRANAPTDAQLDRFKSWIFERAADLRHVYLAGGEPLLMKQNLELLALLKQHNPEVNLRINTNLSRVDTQVFDTICEFPNVHWIISVETLHSEFEYIRHGGSWQDFRQNLQHLRTLQHRITFNMLYFLLNYRSFFDCVDWLQAQGFHNNSFVAGALLDPVYLNVRHLPDHVLQSVMEILDSRIAQQPGYLLEDSYRNIRAHIAEPFAKDMAGSLRSLQQLDQRRNLSSRDIFPELYALTQGT